MNRIVVSSIYEVPKDYTGIVEFVNRVAYVRATYLNGQYHSYDDQPALEYETGSLAWYKNGTGHRIGAAAYINARGIVEWWLDGERWAYESNYWKECWKRYRTPENEQLIMSKLLAGNM